MKNTVFATLILLAGAVSTHSIAPVSSGPPEIYCKHFLYGYPLGTPPTNDLIIRESYALSSDDYTKFPDWICYKLTCYETEGDLDLTRAWKTDPWLDPNETLSANPDEYKGCGNLGYDRGHMAPLGSYHGSRWASQVNYYSNIVPQKAGLNRGPWMELEHTIRDLARYYGDIWVMCGPLYEQDMPALPNCQKPHKVPSGFWKIVAVEMPEGLQVSAFVMGQETPKETDWHTKLATVEEIERRTHLDFFWQMNKKEQYALETSKCIFWE